MAGTKFSETPCMIWEVLTIFLIVKILKYVRGTNHISWLWKFGSMGYKSYWPFLECENFEVFDMGVTDHFLILIILKYMIWEVPTIFLIAKIWNDVIWELLTISWLWTFWSMWEVLTIFLIVKKLCDRGVTDHIRDFEHDISCIHKNL